MTSNLQQAKHILEKSFGYSEFRPLQGEVITNALEENDSLVIMQTHLSALHPSTYSSQFPTFNPDD